MSGGSTDQLILAIDQGTTNSKAALISADGQVVSGGSAAVGISSPRPGWVQQDPERIWSSVLEATAGCLASAPDAEIAGVALSTQRESVVGWQASTGAPLGPVIGWQDRRTADWCNQTINDQDRQLVRARTGLPVDPMFSAPKMRWLLDHLPNGVSVGDVRVGTVDSWLIWRLTGGAEHLCEAGNASRTLLYDITGLDWSHDLLEIFGLPATAMPAVMASDQGFGMTSGVPLVPDKTPILAVLADSHAALYGHGCTDVGSAKATYGTGSSVMAPVAELSTSEARVPTTLAWVIDKSPTYALEGNILSSGATLAWAADLLTDGRVADLVALAETVPDSGGATLVPAFSGLGAPHWDREAHALISGMSPSTTRAHIARAAVDSIAHQICDIVDVIQERSVPLRLFRADGGATSSALVVQTQADLLGREVQVGEVAEVSALGAAKLAWRALGNGAAWPTDSSGRIYRPILDPTERGRRRQHWAGEINRTRLTPSGKAASMPKETAEQWREVDIAFDGPAAANPYTDVEAWVIFTHSSGEQLRRPVFWDGGSSYRVRFASTQPEGEWEWSVYTPEPDHEFRPAHGTLSAGPPVQDHPHRALTRGFVTAHSSGRSFCYADGSPAFWVIDTAWAMPFRATVEDVVVYAADRQSKGFNAVLLMSVQPDMNARGPVGRNVDEGFEVGFHDLSEGRLTKINVEYFQYLDKIIDVLTNHGITPVLQPVFHGFGWKGLDVAGPVVPPADYARYCRYLVARFGARPAIYLPCGDGAGTEPQVEAGGREIHAWDAYGQATGIHYRPHHRNDEHQDADWLDFQSCQTGHMGDHVPDRLATMWAQRPAKAIMNGEPSYEHSGRRGVAEGWWQGHDAWSNLCAGALMGVAYGAASLWPWRLHPDEPGHGTYFLAEGAGWKEALDFAGSRYVGLVGKIIDDLPITRASPCWDVSANTRGLLDPGVLYLGYAEHGGPWMFFDADGRVPSKYWLIDPRTGRVLKSGDRPPNYVPIEFDRYEPSILICAETTPAWVQQQEDAARR